VAGRRHGAGKRGLAVEGTRVKTDPLFDVMSCLRARMPITLLIDLLDPRGPGSQEILHLDEMEAPHAQASPTTVLCSTSSSSAR
jgi:hypothetical protein